MNTHLFVVVPPALHARLMLIRRTHRATVVSTRAGSLGVVSAVPRPGAHRANVSASARRSEASSLCLPVEATRM